MIILDTNVLSELMRGNPDRKVVNWLDRQPASSIWTTSITFMELRYGLLLLPAGKRRDQIRQQLEIVLKDDIEERYASFDSAAAERAAALAASRKLEGRPVELRDTMIAGIVLSLSATLATRNIAHFSELGADVLNPWQD